MLEVQNISKWFGGNPVLKDISFEIKKGEIVGLIGPNGAGKTTLFNVISGFYRSKTGKVIFKGEDISRLKPEDICRRGLCRTFQITKPFSNLTVFKNVVIGALSHTRGIRQAEERAIEVLDLVEMSEKRDLLGRSLTIADRKRLEIARALATSPELLLLDEVMAGLNPNELKEIISLVKRLAESGITLFVIEHIMTVIMGISERIFALDHGELICTGSPQEVANDPVVLKAYLGEDYVASQD
ncbi:MAG: ABC transporter ATP-binding protein [Deltaproteobacteria bacterium]|nr:MAG: ABC transporter ATP-binding protein [Deltaproteobacteria bacterium]